MPVSQTYDFSKPRNKTLITFFAHVENIIKEAYGTQTCDIAINFLEASQAFELAYYGCTQETAHDLQTADEAADEAWGALNDQLRASLRHPKPEKRAAAAAAYMCFAEFDNPTKLNYDEEYEVIQKILDSMHKLPQATLDLAYVSEHLDALQATHDDFLAQMAHRSSNPQPRNNALCKQMRENAISAFNQFVESLNVMERISTDPHFNEIITNLNALITKK